jgi:trk system potassium uptake protein TrkA
MEAMDIQEFVYPESFSAERLALKLHLPGVIDSFQINPNYRLIEVQVPQRYFGRTVNELNLAERYKLVLVTILKRVIQKNIFGNNKSDLQVVGVVSPDIVLQADDVLLLFGALTDLEKFLSI